MLNGGNFGVLRCHILSQVILMLEIGWSMIMACNVTYTEVWMGVLGEIAVETTI